MPGIFGTIYRKNNKNLKNQGRKVCSYLKHLDFYNQKLVSIKNTFTGISVPYAINDMGPLDLNENGLIINIDGKIHYYLDEKNNKKPVENRQIYKILENLYYKYDTDLPRYLSGNFNISIHDTNKNRTIVFNDIIGNRMLYYYYNENILIYGCELKVFIAHNEFKAQIDPMAIADWFNFKKLHGERTFLQGVSLFPAGSVLVFQNGAVKLDNYYITKHTGERSNYSDEQIIEDGWDLLNKSIERSVKGRSSLIIPFSAGLDSRLILYLAKNQGIDYHCFTHADQEKCVEYVVAKKVIREMGVEHYDFLKIEPDLIAKNLLWSNWLNEGIELESISYHLVTAMQYLEFEGINPHKSALLNGIFGAHMSFSETYTKDIHDNRNLSFEERYKLFSAFIKARGKPLASKIEPKRGIFKKDYAEQLSFYAKKSVREELQDLTIVGEMYSEQLEYYIRKIFLRRMMNAKDISRYFVADELIFSDPDLVKFYLTIPIRRKRGGKFYNMLYKKYLPNLLELPTIHTGERIVRKRADDEQQQSESRLINLGDKLIYYSGRLSYGKINIKNKFFYKHPSIWYRTSRKLKSEMEKILLDERTLQRSYLDADALINLVKRERAGGDSYGRLMDVIQYELFIRLFIENDTPPISKEL